MNIQKVTGLSILFCSIVFFLICSSPSKAPDKPRLAPLEDMRAFVNDTLRLIVEPVFAPAKISGFLWSSDGGKTYPETTVVNFIDRTWGPADSGTHRIAVKVFDGSGTISDSIVFNVFVMACRPVLSLIADSFPDFGTPGDIHIVNNSDCRVLKYLWSFDAGISFADTTGDAWFRKQWTINDTGKTIQVTVKAMVVPGLFSEPASLTIHIGCCRPDVVLKARSAGSVNDTTRFLITTLSPCTAACYLWSFDNGNSYTDTSFVPSVLKRWDVRDTNIRLVSASIKTVQGVLSRPDTVYLRIGYCLPIIHLNGATAIHAGDTTGFFITNATQCPAAFYLWSFNNGRSFTDTTYNPSIVKHWKASDTSITMVIAAAKTPEGIESPTDTLRVFATPCLPLVRLSADTAAFVGDTTRFLVTAFSTCSPVAWRLWSYDGGRTYADTVKTDYIYKYWSLADTGSHEFFAKVQTIAGEVSSADSCEIRVFAGLPEASLPRDTTVTAGDTAVIIARIDSSHRPLAYCAWTIDHAAQEIKTNGNILIYYWPVEKAGVHRLFVRAIDVKGFSSAQDSMTVTSVIAYPTLKVPPDTLLKSNDTLTATVVASVANGKIVQYLWDIGSLNWTDSGPSPQRKIRRQGKDTLGVRVGVRDNRGVMKTDSFHVYFNAPPSNPQMAAPRSGDTVIFHSTDSTFIRGAVSFRFSALDKNGGNDTLTYKLYLGKSAAIQTKVYEGHDTVWTSVTPLDTTVYYWTLMVKDRMGDSAQTAGSFTCLLQKTLCFAGHSIIVGYGGDGVNGGFRNKVLASMRVRRGGSAKVKPIGPLTSGYMAVKPDDSCFAVAGYRARELWLLMSNSFPALTADVWVVMLGVNDSYNYNTEFKQLLWIIDAIYARNPLACAYVINGLPYKGSYGMDKIFNGWLADSIAVRRSANPNRNLWNINAYTKFAINDTANPKLFAPELPYLLHPNQAGYDTLSQMLLDTMKIKFP
jgi:lysophospholipase L1-like esterase